MKKFNMLMDTMQFNRSNQLFLNLIVSFFCTFSAFTLLAQPVQGDLAFTAFNADEDGWALVTLVDLPANTTIYFTDNEATSPTAFADANESSFQWVTGAAVIPAGTVVRFAAIDQATRSASVGTFTAVNTSGLGLSQQSEPQYLPE
jgi:hypothetical protein